MHKLHGISLRVAHLSLSNLTWWGASAPHFTKECMDNLIIDLKQKMSILETRIAFLKPLVDELNQAERTLKSLRITAVNLALLNQVSSRSDK